jgi:hypothetical protein
MLPDAQSEIVAYEATARLVRSMGINTTSDSGSLLCRHGIMRSCIGIACMDSSYPMAIGLQPCVAQNA